MSAFYASVEALPTPIWCCLVICGVGLVIAGCVAILTWWENKTNPVYRAPENDEKRSPDGDGRGNGSGARRAASEGTLDGGPDRSGESRSSATAACQAQQRLSGRRTVEATPESDHRAGSEPAASHTRRDPALWRDQVRSDMQRRLRSIPTNQKGQR